MALKKLKHTSTIRDYVKELLSSMLDIQDCQKRISCLTSSRACKIGHKSRFDDKE